MLRRRLARFVPLALVLLLGGCSSTSAVPTDGGQGNGTIGIPAQAPYDTWSWHPVDGALCGNGSPTGIGLNPHASSAGLLVYLNGGGACWDNQGCFVHPTASFLGGFGEVEFTLGVAQLGNAGVFNRADASNPFKDFDFAFVPYCTGDLHAGSHVQAYSGGNLHHVGHDNVQALLRVLVPTFGQPKQLVLAGSSAGGFGAVFNYEAVRTAFNGQAPVLVDDSGPFLRPPYLSTALEQLTTNVWGVAPNLPSGCTRCVPTSDLDTGYHQLWEYLAASHPDFRGSLISSLRDATIRGFFSTSPGNPALAPCATDGGTCLMTDGLRDFDTHVAQAASPGQARVFYLDSSQHVWLLGPLGSTTSQGVSLGSFLQEELTADGGWNSVSP